MCCLIGLIGCSKRKATKTTIPCLLYQGTRFQLALNKACGSMRTDRVFVISAKHGLVHMYEEIEPYDESLADKTPEERDEWGREIVQKLMPYLRCAKVVVLAEDLYADPLRPHLPNAEFPLTGMDEKEQQAWLASS